MLREILAIKNFREGKAESALRRQRDVLAEAVSQRERAQRRLEEFIDYAREQERRLYGGLVGQVVRLKDIQDVHLAVGEIRGQQHDFERSVEQAEQERLRELQVMDERRQAHAEASRMKEKFVELVGVHAQEETRIAERKEDAEMEEASETRRDRMDWDDGSEEDG